MKNPQNGIYQTNFHIVYNIVIEIICLGENNENSLDLISDTRNSNDTIIPLNIETVNFLSQQNQGILQKSATSLENNHTGM